MPPTPRTRTRAALGVLAVAALALAGCGEQAGDVDRETFRADFGERTGGKVDGAVLDCLTEAIWDSFDQDDVNLIYRAATEEELGDDLREQLTVINQDCYERFGPAPEDDAGEAGTETETTDGEPTDGEPADGEPADGEPADTAGDDAEG